MSFADWNHYHIDQTLLSSLELPSDHEFLQRELEKVSTFLHMKGTELEHVVRSSEHFLFTNHDDQEDDSERIVRMGQIEESLSIVLGQIHELARLRLSNFSYLWYLYHDNDWVTRLIRESPLFVESSLETNLLFRVSQLFQCITEDFINWQNNFPTLQVWRGNVNLGRIRQVHRRIAGKLTRHADMMLSTTYLDDQDGKYYRQGLKVEAPRREIFSITTERDTARVCHDQYLGPWFAGSHQESAILVEENQVGPFLNSELNLDRIPNAHEQRRAAQRLQRRIILEQLSPVLVSQEERTEYRAEGIVVVVREDISVRRYNGDSKDLAFGVIEVHFESPQSRLPEWLWQLFFESLWVHPVLDFDLYLHGIAVCSEQLDAYPYWMVDSQWMEEPSLIDETTPLLLIRTCPRCVCGGGNIRYCLTIVLLAATVLSLAVALWSYHGRILDVLEELFEIITGRFANQ